MGDGGFPIFLLIVFVFWILESIAKARQRARQQQMGELEDEEPSPTDARPHAEAPGESRQGPPQRPRNLWEEIAELSRQQAEQQQQRRPQPQRIPSGQRIEPPIDWTTAPGPRPEPAAPVARPTSSRWEEGSGREISAYSGPSTEEKRSDRWVDGSRPEVLAGPEAVVPVRKAAPAPARPAKKVPARTGRKELTRPSLKTAHVEREHGTFRDSRRSLKDVSVVAAEVVPVSMSVQHLRSASRSELQRLLVLNEVLGLPVALKDE